MKLRNVVRDVPTAENLFEPWERLLLVSMHLDGIETPGVRELADACFACVKHMAGRMSREDAYRAVKRALDAVMAIAKEPATPAPEPEPARIQARLPIDGMTVHVSSEAYATVAYATVAEYAPRARA